MQEGMVKGDSMGPPDYDGRACFRRMLLISLCLCTKECLLDNPSLYLCTIFSILFATKVFRRTKINSKQPKAVLVSIKAKKLKFEIKSR